MSFYSVYAQRVIEARLSSVKHIPTTVSVVACFGGSKKLCFTSKVSNI